MVHHGLSSFRPTEAILTHEKKFRNTKPSWVFLIFLNYVKIASVGLKLDRPQLQHWLLCLEHNRPTPKSENSNVVDLPVRMGYDCVCASACVSSSHSDFEWCKLQFEFWYNLNQAGSSSCGFETSWIEWSNKLLGSLHNIQFSTTV